MTLAWNARGISHTAKLVLLALADNANDAGVCWPAIPSIADRCALDERTVFRAVAMLEGGGHLTLQARPGRSTVYRVHPCQAVTPDSAPPLTGSPPTPVTKSPTPDSLSPPSPLRGDLTVKEPKKNRQSARARSRRAPDDFRVTEEMRKWAAEKCPGVDLDRETESFRDHEYREPHSDWPAAWRQWIRRSPDFKRNGGGSAVAAPTRTWRPSEEEGGQC